MPRLYSLCQSLNHYNYPICKLAGILDIAEPFVAGFLSVACKKGMPVRGLTEVTEANGQISSRYGKDQECVHSCSVEPQAASTTVIGAT